ncbi:hypothetical protein DET65_2612 [Sunxiuqinia elliptica]|uniref:Lipoprotein n=2 Tax=Sunxiuqinia elliptica TaxID=655355 RepID=A0A4R6H4S9_9BACT|nr:hypothetical protein DET52_10369 [Sunxiuqinia elliptica]TDO59328.1 hypothetical protein DET65_2612 [Sunxiuqinia elliptica]
MKTISLKIGILLLAFALMGAGCEKDTPSETLAPGLVIYKTKKDYFENVHTWLKDGKVIFIQSFHQKIELDNEGYASYKFRSKLIDGYVLAAEHPVTTAFLSYSIQDYSEMEAEGSHPSMDEIENNIIDDDPFVEYYYDATSPRTFEMRDTAQINEIIRNGEIEKFFRKLKQ